MSIVALRTFEEQLEKVGHTYLTGPRVTYADLALFLQACKLPTTSLSLPEPP